MGIFFDGPVQPAKGFLGAARSQGDHTDFGVQIGVVRLVFQLPIGDGLDLPYVLFQLLEQLLLLVRLLQLSVAFQTLFELVMGLEITGFVFDRLAQPSFGLRVLSVAQCENASLHQGGGEIRRGRQYLIQYPLRFL